jgi:hypothetical protein
MTYLPSLGSPRDLDHLWLTCIHAVMNVEARELKSLSINIHERGRALPVMGITPALVEGAACVKLTGEAERAMATKPERLAPWVQGVSRCKLKALP